MPQWLTVALSDIYVNIVKARYFLRQRKGRTGLSPTYPGVSLFLHFPCAEKLFTQALYNVIFRHNMVGSALILT